jgi:hypothetical protein
LDITQLILDDHHEQRRLFALLEQIDCSEPENLAALWHRLAIFLDLHAETEEKVFYPALLGVGRAAGEAKEVDAATSDAIKDHNEIRDCVAAVSKHAVGSEAWIAAVAAANKANSEHMGEEEREGLTDFRTLASLEVRHELGVKFATYEAVHWAGVKPVDKDPAKWVDQHG